MPSGLGVLNIALEMWLIFTELQNSLGYFDMEEKTGIAMAFHTDKEDIRICSACRFFRCLV